MKTTVSWRPRTDEHFWWRVKLWPMPWPTSGSHRRTQSCWGENNLSLRSQGLFYMELESNFGLGLAPSFWLKKCCIGRFLLKKIWPFNALTFNEVCYILLWIFLTTLRDFSRDNFVCTLQLESTPPRRVQITLWGHINEGLKGKNIILCCIEIWILAWCLRFTGTW